jgi:tRNA threonylcarbamoyladenosine biosynthesis protein TsaE
MKYISKSYNDTINIAKEFAKGLKPFNIILMTGDLGAGKTSFVNGILEGLGFFNGASSPTFTIVNEYPSNPPINHFDLYRIKDEDELFEIGFVEYLESGKINIIEWAENAKSILNNYKTIKVDIEQTQIEDERIITID